MSNHLAREANDPAAAQVLRFWFGETPEYGSRLKRWFEKDGAFDSHCRALFLAVYEEAAGGSGMHWLQAPADCLARIIVLDQFPRNMFRGSPRAFAADGLALQAARHAVAHRYDATFLPVERLFAYLPYEHSEALADQLMACALTEPLNAFPETADAYPYAVAHRDIIARFGRFPHRNAALGRASTPEEVQFLMQPGSSF
jgi:uncharacterized protein (DUF924 family)